MDRTVAIRTPAGQPDSRAAREPGILVPQPASEQLVVGDIPREPPGFQPRAHLLAELDRVGPRVSVAYSAAETQGVGTTQLAAGYARASLAAGWRLVAWIDAADAASLLAGLAAVADAAGLSDGCTSWDSATAGEAVRRWLEADGDRCLIVFDGAADPDALRPFVPTAGAARVLITSTRPSTASLGTNVAVDAFTAGEALALLTGPAGPAGAADAADAAALAAELGYLPLALAQAAAVTAGHDLEYGTYLARLRAAPVDEHLAGTGGQPSVAAAVSLSVQAARATDRTGVCARMLEIAAMLSAAGVRRELLHVAGQAGLLTSRGHGVPAALVDRALEWLGRRSLLTFSLDGQTVTMHPMVARVVRDGLARRRRLAATGLVAASVLDEYALALARSADRSAVRAIPQHVAALLDNVPARAVAAGGELAGTLLRLRFIALYHLVELGDSAPQAIAVGEPLTADLERLLGPDHPDTLNARNSLAAAYLAAGRVAEAIPLFEHTLAIWERMLGPDDPDTLTARNNLAAAYQDAGRADAAIPLYELNLAARERLLGPDHPVTLNSRGNLAAAYRDGGRVAEAIPLLEQTLAGRERVLGPDHPDTRTSRRNLAAAYRDGGRVAEATRLLDQIRADSPRLLGADHPGTRTWRRKIPGGSRDGDRVAETLTPGEQTPAARQRQPADRITAPALPVDFRRPPADPALRVLPAGLRRPPADPAGRLPPASVARSPAAPAGHPAVDRAQDLPPADAQYDDEIVAAIAAGDPAGIATAYDRYAAALYGYCHAMLPDPATAAEALQDAFVIAAATLGGLRGRPEFRPWLYAVVRNQCQRLLPAARRARRGQSGRHDTAAGDGGDGGQAELRAAIGAILAELRPREREVIELSFRHDLHGPDLATALGMPPRRADALAARARDRLAKALAALGVALAGREACPPLGELLADWDGWLTEETRDLVDWHAEQCRSCAARRPGALRPEALSVLLPPAPLPPELREQVLSRCSATTAEAAAYRRRLVRHAKSTGFAWFFRAIRHLSWDGVRANPGPAIATAAVAVWGAAAVSVLLLTFAGYHAADARAARPSVRASSAGPATAATSATVPTVAARPPSTVSQAPSPAQSPVQPSPSPSSPLVASSSSSPSATPSPSHTASPSPTPSHTTSPTTSPSPSSSPSPSASRSSSSSPPPTP